MSSDEEQDPAPRRGLPISALPVSVRPSARKLVAELDADGDGFLDERELATALDRLNDARRRNRSLARVAAGLAGASLLLVGAVFGSSVAAARLSKDISVDEGGVLRTRGTGSVVRTSEALAWSAGKKVADMTNRELARLQDVSELDGDLHFKVRGYARPPGEEGRVVLLVDGGTVTYDADGMADATGDARDLIGVAFGAEDAFERKLGDPLSCRRLVDGHAGILRNLCGDMGGGGNASPSTPSSVSTPPAAAYSFVPDGPPDIPEVGDWI